MAGTSLANIVPYRNPVSITDISSSTSTSPLPKAGPSTGTFSTGNMSSGDLSQLTSAINAMNVSGQQSANAARIPGAYGLEETSSGNIAQELAGQVPVDVLNLIGQQAAERGISGANTNAAYLRALGLTSLGQQEKGQADLSAAYARNPAAPLFDPTTMILTPYQSGQLGTQASQIQLGYTTAAQDYAIQQQKLAQEAAYQQRQLELQKEQQEEAQREFEQSLQAQYDKLGLVPYGQTPTTTISRIYYGPGGLPGGIPGPSF